jgi:hypothetical protein
MMLFSSFEELVSKKEYITHFFASDLQKVIKMLLKQLEHCENLKNFKSLTINDTTKKIIMITTINNHDVSVTFEQFPFCIPKLDVLVYNSLICPELKNKVLVANINRFIPPSFKIPLKIWLEDKPMKLRTYLLFVEGWTCTTELKTVHKLLSVLID